ncbi:MAG: HEAT repeat domain-containing protein [Streptosporangiaceae bacterium]
MTSSRLTPSQTIAAECQRRGSAGVVSGCIDLLEAREVDDALVLALGGESAPYVLSGREGGKHGYWPRVWGARGLLYVWEDRATPAIVHATADDAWRVREMAAKVIARHRVDDALEAVTGLRADQVPRVRSAADRAIARLTVSGP